MKNFVLDASGVAIGTLLYTRFVSAEQEFDFARAVFVGVVGSLLSLLWQKKDDPDTEPASER